MYPVKYYNELKLDISLDECKKEIQSLKEYSKPYFETGYHWNKCVLKYQWTEFYKNEIKLWNNIDIRTKLIKNRLKYIKKGYGQISHKEILRGFKISGIYVGYSHHSPLWIKGFSELTNSKFIYDPCGGWGHRMLGANITGIHYIYNDINKNVCNNVKKMSNELGFKNMIIYNKDSSLFNPTENYDSVFTCPPYWNTEIYSDYGIENKSYKEYLIWWENVIKQVYIKAKHIGLVISSKYSDDLSNIIQKYGYSISYIFNLGSNKHISHMNKNNKKQKELLIIFEKNNIINT